GRAGRVAFPAAARLADNGPVPALSKPWGGDRSGWPGTSLRGPGIEAHAPGASKTRPRPPGADPPGARQTIPCFCRARGKRPVGTMRKDDPGRGVAVVRIEQIDLKLVRLPLVRTFRTSSSTKDHLDHILVRVSADGLAGWGECASPSDPYYCPETT